MRISMLRVVVFRQKHQNINTKHEYSPFLNSFHDLQKIA